MNPVLLGSMGTVTLVNVMEQLEPAAGVLELAVQGGERLTERIPGQTPAHFRLAVGTPPRLN